MLSVLQITLVLLIDLQAFKSYPNNIEDMDELIHSERARAECYFETDQRVVDEYENRKEEIERLAEEVGSHEDDIVRCTSKIRHPG